MTCPTCGARQPDGLLCQHCTNRLLADLAALPIYMAELHTTIRRQAQTGDGNEGKNNNTNPLPVDLEAARVRDSVINTIGTWIRELSLGDDVNLGPNIRAWCRWLADRIQRIRGHQAVDEIVDELHYAVGIVRSTIDPSRESVYCGKCQICGKELRANPDADKAICRRCEIIGVESTLPVPSRKADAWKKAEDRLLTRPEVQEAFTYYHLEVPASTLRRWTREGRLSPYTYTRSGQPAYMLGDALALARNPERVAS